MTIQQAEATAQEVMYLYYKFGAADYIGEPVSQLEHMSQSAELAIEEGFDDEVILAAFFHDIGHICVMQDSTNSMGGFGIRRHEQIGADFLRSKGFSERLARLVENHVQAKRYLTYQYPEYYHALSQASKETLTYQGGPMTREEAQEFANDPLFEPSIQLRRWDELAKETNIPIIDLDVIKSKIVRVLSSTGG
ncbi:MAG TPA: HDIG domain-containing protein [Cyclobacteriaceae bacterium]|nr:HDIG domain-containing protein [Cyclobacteriaceae bacterium]